MWGSKRWRTASLRTSVVVALVEAKALGLVLGGIGRAIGTDSRVGSKSFMSWRLAPACAIPIRIPAASVRSERFAPLGSIGGIGTGLRPAERRLHPGAQHQEDRVHRVAVGHPRVVTTQRVLGAGRGGNSGSTSPTASPAFASRRRGRPSPSPASYVRSTDRLRFPRRGGNPPYRARPLGPLLAGTGTTGDVSYSEATVERPKAFSARAGRN
jgi:hypothetical protein